MAEEEGKIQEVTEEDGPSSVNIIQRLRGQIDSIDILVTKGLYLFIDPKYFPDLPKPWVEMARYYAFCSIINRLGEIRDTTPQEDLKRKLGGEMTGLIRARDRVFMDSLKVEEGEEVVEEDKELLTAEALFKQTGDANATLSFAINFGLYDRINGRNFPALKALTDAEIARLQARALRMRLDDLREQEGSMKPHAGFPSEQDNERLETLRDRLKKEIDATEQLRLFLIEKFLDGQVS